MIKVVLLLGLLAAVSCDVKQVYDAPDYKYDVGYRGDYGRGYGYGYPGYAGYAYAANKNREAHVNLYNGLRQHAVNAAAEHYGAGTGVAAAVGVPGTPVGVNPYYGGYGYGRGYGGYAYGRGYGPNNYAIKY